MSYDILKNLGLDQLDTQSPDFLKTLERLQREALQSLDKDRGFLKAGGVFDDDQIDSYIELKMAEVMRFEMTPHPVEYDMYYSV